MDNIHEKTKIIQEMLMKYCDPKPEYTNTMASEIARIIMDRILDSEDKDIEKELENIKRRITHEINT